MMRNNREMRTAGASARVRAGRCGGGAVAALVTGSSGAAGCTVLTGSRTQRGGRFQPSLFARAEIDEAAIPNRPAIDV